MKRQKYRPVVLVTGGDSGIGLGIAHKFAEEGYRIVICGLRSSARARAIASLARSRYEAAYFVTDLRQENQIERLVRQTVERFGGLDVLCNNAGIQKLAALERASSSLWDEVMEVNLRGAFLCTRFALPHLKKTKGSIINIGSTAGLVGYAGGSAYCASKAALVMLSKTSALELAPHGVRVNCICPGATRTPLIPVVKIKPLSKHIPLGHVGEPSDVAELAFYLASEKARQITGGVYVIDGGITAGRPRLA
jgi:NAD(P)-dependent dehydrogenase (short-subunit alcohol dehydrogenase family)